MTVKFVYIVNLKLYLMAGDG